MKFDNKNKTILIVDDEEANRLLLANSLSHTEFSTLTAANGEEALSLLNEYSDSIQAVLLDLNMPGMSGLELLKQIKVDRRFTSLPIIIQTADTEASSIQECMKNGAFYYLSKPYEMSVMRAVVKAAASEYQLIGSLYDTIEEHGKICNLLRKGSFDFRTPDDVNTLSKFITNRPGVPPDVRMGLSELMLNAIEHGNLEISYDEKGQLIENNRWIEEIQHRLIRPEYKDRFAQINFEDLGDRMTFTITDQGDGFDWQQYLELDPDRLYDTHGRGIMIANSFSFDSLQYHGAGNSVTATTFLEG